MEAAFRVYNILRRQNLRERKGKEMKNAVTIPEEVLNKIVGGNGLYEWDGDDTCPECGGWLHYGEERDMWGYVDCWVECSKCHWSYSWYR